MTTQFRQALTSGLVAGAVITFFILIGIPGGGSDTDALPSWFAWSLFCLTAFGFGYFAARPRSLAAERTQTLLKSLRAGLIVGIGAASVMVAVACALNAAQLLELSQPPGGFTLASELRPNIAKIADVFANVTPRTTAVLSGLPVEAIQPPGSTPRADPTLRFFLMACLLPIAAILGGGANQVARRIRQRRIGRPVVAPAAWRTWLPIALPVIFFTLLVFNAVAPTSIESYKNLIGSNAQLTGLLASFLLVGSGLIALRTTTSSIDTQSDTSSAFLPRALVLIVITLVFFGIGLAAPTRPAGDLMFSPKTPNLTQITGADGKPQVITEDVTPLDTDTLLNYRRLVIGLIGFVFIAGNVAAARTRMPLRTLVAANVLLGALVIAPMYLDKYQQSVLLLIGINILLGLGLNIVIGYAGLLDLGYVAFFAIGAYVYAFFSSNQDVRVGTEVVGLKYGGNDQAVQNIAAAIIVGIIVVPIIVAAGLRLWQQRGSAQLQSPSARIETKRPAWLGYVLVGMSVLVTLLIINALRGTAFYESFAGFPAFIIGILLGILFAAMAGVLLGIPVLRLRGDYLAIVTLGFGEIIRLFLNNLRDITGGPGGIVSIPHASIGSVEIGSNEGQLYVVILGCILVAVLSLRLRSSKLGRAWGALKSDEDIAQAMGVNLVNAKVLAFAIGAGFAGIGGVIFAARQVNIFPDNFTLSESINVLSLIIIGGMGSIPGVIVGALVLIGVPESLRVFASYRVMAFGALLVAMMLLRPSGLLPQPPQPMEGRARRLIGEVE